MKRHAPAAARNRDPILEVLRRVLPAEGKVLEIASGTGEHTLHFATALPELIWQPSDLSDEALVSIAAHRADGPPNIRPPVMLDVRHDDWGDAASDLAALLCINMIHIAPWSCCEALMRGAGRHLPARAPLVLYGPYRFDGRFTAPSNETFDASLRHRDPSWGVRDVADITREAERHGLTHEEVVEMPANNHILVFRRVE